MSEEGPAAGPAGGDAGAAVSLRALGEQLLNEARAAGAGRAARTVVALPGLRTTLLALAEGRELAEHEAPGSATLVCLAGQVVLVAGDRQWRLGEYDVAAIPAERHSLHAQTDALALLTVRLD
jgi:quercetin dioxygenase-like cupin family protein